MRSFKLAPGRRGMGGSPKRWPPRPEFVVRAPVAASVALHPPCLLLNQWGLLIGRLRFCPVCLIVLCLARIDSIGSFKWCPWLRHGRTERWSNHEMPYLKSLWIASITRKGGATWIFYWSIRVIWRAASACKLPTLLIILPTGCIGTRKCPLFDLRWPTVLLNFRTQLMGEWW